LERNRTSQRFKNKNHKKHAPAIGTALLAALLLTAAPATEISAGQLQPGNEALHTEPSQDLESILTDDQKALLEKMKEKLAAGELETDEDINSAITECEEELQITLTDDQKDQIAALIKQINQLGLDPDAILSKAQELYEDQLKESADAAIQENVVEPVKEAVVEGAKSAVRDFFHDMVDSIKSFFARMLP
jgi:uncharacterized protein YpuA (DUF1002 family)